MALRKPHPWDLASRCLRKSRPHGRPGLRRLGGAWMGPYPSQESPGDHQTSKYFSEGTVFLWQVMTYTIKPPWAIVCLGMARHGWKGLGEEGGKAP